MSSASKNYYFHDLLCNISPLQLQNDPHAGILQRYTLPYSGDDGQVIIVVIAYDKNGKSLTTESKNIDYL